MPAPKKGAKPKAKAPAATAAKPGTATRAAKLQRDTGKTKRGK